MSKMKELKKSIKAAIESGRAERKLMQDLKDPDAEKRFQAALAELPKAVYSAVSTRSGAIVMMLETEDFKLKGGCDNSLGKEDLKGVAAKMYEVCAELDLCPVMTRVGKDGTSSIVIHGAMIG